MPNILQEPHILHYNKEQDNKSKLAGFLIIAHNNVKSMVIIRENSNWWRAAAVG